MKNIKFFFNNSIFIFCLYAQNNERISVNNVLFIDNFNINSNELKSQLELKPPSILTFNSVDFDRRLLKLDAINIKNYYNSKGFLQTTVRDSFIVNNGLVDIFFIISEGSQYFLKDVKIVGLNSVNNAKILAKLGLFKGQPYNPIKINKKLSIIDEALQEKGKIFATINVEQVIEDSVQIIIQVNEGKNIIINDSWISGAERIDTTYVRNEMEFKNGELFNKKKIDKTAKSNVSTPITRFDSNNVMVQFVQWLGQGGHYRQCTGFEKDENDESIYDEPLYSDYLISDSLYFGKDTNEGDNSDNGHYTIYTKKCELIDDRGQSIK